MVTRVILKPSRAKPFFARHPWVFGGAIDRIEGEARDGDVVDLVSSAEHFIARGLYNSQSKIRVRLYSWSADTTLEAAFFREKLEAALRLRRDVLGLVGPGKACRLVFSESDGLSGLVVDAYDRWLVLQFTSLGLAQRRELLADLLHDLLRPEGIYLRTEKGIGQLEGLALQDGLMRGNLPEAPLVVDDQGIQMRVNLAEGQKTGFYLDQRDNRRAVAELAMGRRMLDGFCYTGGFGLHASRAGAREVLGVDISAPALELAQENARLNECGNVRFEKADVFDRLQALVAGQERFGLVVLDPPKFARAGHAVDEALRGYRQLQTQALRLLEPEGILAMCCCSGLITQEMLLGVLAQVSADQKRPVQILQVRGASPDHPVLASCMETNYLKCVICRVS